MRFKRYVSVLLTVCMIIGCMTFGMTVAAAGGETTEIIFKDEFSGTAIDETLWVYPRGGALVDGALQIQKEDWPSFNMPQLDSNSVYRFSYDVKATAVSSDTDHELLKTYVRDCTTNGQSFGSYKPGYGFVFRNLGYIESLAIPVTEINRWYTVETEFCEKEGEQYTKWTVKDTTTGDVLGTDSVNSLWNSDKREARTTSSSGMEVNLWNSHSTDVDMYVDNVKLEKVVTIDPNVVFIEDFNGESLDSSFWIETTNASRNSAIEDGAMKLTSGQWPGFKVPTLDTNSAYKLSYKVKATGNAAPDAWEILKFQVRDAENNGRTFGSYKPGYGFVFKSIAWNDTYNYTSEAVKPINVWYTVETEFCEKADSQYTKWTVKDEEGNVLYNDSVHSLWSAYKSEATTAGISGLEVYIENAEQTRTDEIMPDIYVDYIKLEKVDINVPDEVVVFKDEFSGDALDSRWTAHSGVLEDGAMKIAGGAWPAFFMPTLSTNYAYKFSYDVMSKGAAASSGHDLLKVYVRDTVNNGRSFGSYGPGKGFTFGGLNWSNTYSCTDDNVKPINVWYTVETEFWEKEGYQYTKWTVKDTTTGEVLYTEQIDGLWNAEKGSTTTASVSGMEINFYNNDETNKPDIYVDNVTLTGFIPPLSIEPDKAISATDYFGNSTKLTDGITAAVEKISMVFSEDVTQESAASGISLKVKDGDAVTPAVSVDGKTVTLTLSELLKPTTQYQLVIADTLETSSGKVLEGPVTVEFTTAAVDDELAKINTPPVEEQGALTAGESFTVNALVVNHAEADKPVTMIAAFYSDGVLVDAQISDSLTAPAGKAKTLDFVVTTPQNVNDITSMKVFLLDNLGSLKPMAKAYEILFGIGFSNLVTTFKGDAETSRGFAWTAVPGRSDMVIRYAENDAVLEEDYTEVEADSTEYNGRLYYKADLSGLTEGTEYNYIIGDAVDGVWSPVYTFATEATEQNGFSFIAVTDTQGGSQSTYDLYEDVLDAAVAKRPDTKFMLSLGDLVDIGYDEKQWDMYFDAAEEYCTSIPHMAIVGNHETRDDASTPEYEAGLNFRLHFNNSTEAATTVRQNISENDLSDDYAKGILENIEGSVYSFDYGDVHVAALNSGSDWYAKNSSIKLLTAQKSWLEQDLKASTAKWKIVILHQGLYPARTDRYFGSRDVLEDMLVECGVDLVLQGHDHMVARTYPMKDDSVVTTNTPDSVDEGEGIVYLIPGSAGDKRYSSSTVGTQPDYLKTLINTSGSQPTYSIIDVTDAKLSVNTYKLNGDLADSFEIIGSNE